MTAELPAHLDLYLVAAGIVLALLAVAIGATTLVREALAFKKRVEGYKSLPFAPALELAQAKTNALSRSIDSAPQLVERAQRAIAAIDAAKVSSQESARLAFDFVRSFFSRR